MASLKRKGALDNKDVKALIDQKLAEATTDQCVSTMKAKEAIEVELIDLILQYELPKRPDPKP
jgi:hypothetical protein